MQQAIAAGGRLQQMAHPFGDLGRPSLLPRSGVARPSMRWDQINFERATWTILSAAAETGAKHLVPLLWWPSRIIEVIPRSMVSPFRRFRLAEGAVALSAASAWRDGEQMRRSAAQPRGPGHDLLKMKRAYRHGLVGVLPHIGERVEPRCCWQIAKIYDVYKYQPEVRRAESSG